MRFRKVLISLATAVAALAAFASMASANHLSFSSQTLRATWTSFEFSGGFGTIRCNLTLEKSLHSRTINKTAGLLIGAITRASIGPCASGSFTVLTESLPWHVQYASFEGTLPTIVSVTTNIIGLALQLREPTFGITCLMRSEASHPARLIYNLRSGSVTSVTLGGSIPCGSFTGTLGGSSATNSALTITLI